MICKFPSPCWYARNVQNVTRSRQETVNQGQLILDSKANPSIFDRMLESRQKSKKKTVEIVEKLPPLTPFLEKTPGGRIYNLVTEMPEPFVELASYGLLNEGLLIIYAKLV